MFQAWARKHHPEITEYNDNGEWCFCPEFEAMCSDALRVIEHISAEQASEQMIDDLLYAIARDNECSVLVTELEAYSDWFSLLCRHSLRTNYVNAKWQFAGHLCHYQGNDDLPASVYDFLDSGDEYTERLALKALADLYPDCAEPYAIAFWERNKYEYDEYQKIMVLHVLDQIHSSNLARYLDLAEQSDYPHLRENANEIRGKQTSS